MPNGAADERDADDDGADQIDQIEPQADAIGAAQIQLLPRLLVMTRVVALGENDMRHSQDRCLLLLLLVLR